jgi:DNA-binding XRE family transcriptional regulator
MALLLENLSSLCELRLYANIEYVNGVLTIRTKRHKQLIEILVAERKRRGITQVGLAEQLGVSQTWIVRLESGSRRLDVVEFIALAEVIGFSPLKIIKTLSKIEPELFAPGP